MDDKILYFRIRKVQLIKILTETLNNMTSEVVWTFTKSEPKNPKTFIGMEISTPDPSKTIFFKCKFNSKLFKSYYCEPEKYNLGISLENLNKIFKLVDKDDSLIYFSVDKNDEQNLIINIGTREKKNKTTYKLKLVTTQQSNKQSTKIDFEKKINMSSDEFHKLCKEMNIFSEYLNINCSSKKVIFSCQGTCANRSSIYQNGEDDLVITGIDEEEEEDEDEKKNEEDEEESTSSSKKDKKKDNKKSRVIGNFELKNIILFNKFTSVCSTFTIYMKNNYALVLIYDIDKYGSITISFSPIQEDTIRNIAYSYSDDEDELDMKNNGQNILED